MTIDLGRRDFSDVGQMVSQTLHTVGRKIHLATPLGLGKPVHLINEFYRRAVEDSRLDLTILTALSLTPPRASSELERRLLEPIHDRLFGDYPRLDYVRDVEEGSLPDNVEVREFYFQPGSRLDNPRAQQTHVCTNFTHAVRDMMRFGVNVIAQMVTPARTLDGGAPVHSLSCNADLTLDLLDALEYRPHETREEYVVLGQINRNLPFMYGDCLVEKSAFDGLLEAETYHHDLFSVPQEPVGKKEYAIGMHASRLVRDGGTLQIGIGSLSDGLTRMLLLRDDDNATYRDLVDRFEPSCRPCERTLIDAIGGHDPFEEGLYGATEMLVPGFVELCESGVLSRRVYDDRTLQRYVNERDGDETVTVQLLERLVEAGRVAARPSAGDMDFLHRHGILRRDVRREEDRLVLPDGTEVPADLSDPDVLEALAEDGLGDRLKNGVHAHAGFFLGPASMYEFLREMEEARRRCIRMTRISFVNDLYGRQPLKEAQRREARFLNSAMMVTLSGAVVSDGLEDMRVVSGVGGQYNFVAMAHELRGGRSIVMLRSTRTDDGEVTSNIVYNYGHATIPRHLRDVVVTEYGIADLRGRSDRGVIEEMLSVTDARFQPELVERAREAGKLPPDWQLPDRYRENTPDKIDAWAASAPEGVLEPFPFGTELTGEEVQLAGALRGLRKRLAAREVSPSDLAALPEVLFTPMRAGPYLDRMGLDYPSSLREWGLQKVVLLALKLHGTI